MMSWVCANFQVPNQLAHFAVGKYTEHFEQFSCMPLALRWGEVELCAARDEE